jgi:hypothetical protein
MLEANKTWLKDADCCVRVNLEIQPMASAISSAQQSANLGGRVLLAKWC